MSAALAAPVGLIGVVIGAVAAGAIAELREALREQALVRGVLRVLQLDLLELRAQIRWSLDEDRVGFSQAETSRITRTWFDFRDLLARHLRAEDEWAPVAKTFQTVLVWGDRCGERLDGDDRTVLAGWLAAAGEARAVLEAWVETTGQASSRWRRLLRR